MAFVHDDKIWFFGGRSKKKKEAHLYTITIGWDKGSPVQAEIKQVKRPNGETVTFTGHPTFSPNIPNKKYIPELQTWLFLDDQGGQHLLNL